MRNRTLTLLLYAFLLLLLSPGKTFSQVGLSIPNSRIEIGLNVGPMNFLGDLGGNRGKGTYGPKDNNIPMTNAMIGVAASWYPTEWLGLRLAGNYGQMEGDDNIIKDQGSWEVARLYRNLTFRSPLYEGYAAIEFYPTAMITLLRGEGLPRFRPYGIVGAGIFKFEPEGLYTDPNGNQRWVKLRPLRLEGQGMAETGRPMYSLTAYNLPLGIGIKYDLTERITLGVELIHRFTTTDYIDDVSTTYIDPNLFDLYLSPADAAIARRMANPSSYFPTNIPGYRPYRIGRPRGNPKRNDGYFSSQFRVTWKIGDVYADWFRNKKSVRCPVYF